MKYLIVDDNKQNSTLLSKILADYGSGDAVDNGPSALDIYKSSIANQEKIDVIFLDIMMPEMDGHSVLYEIRMYEEENDDINSPVKVVMTTALDDTDTVMKSFDSGCQHYLVKPYSKTEIYELMIRMEFISAAE